jgi:hypothetical protein
MILRSLFTLTAGEALAIQQDNDELYLIELEPLRPPRLWKLITVAHLKDL